MEKNDIIEIRITDMTSEGAGIGRAADGTAVFVDGAVLGDLAEARVTKLKKNYALAECIRLIERSEDRVSPYCPWQEECGGCGLGSLNYGAQLKLKEDQVLSKIKRIGGIENPNIKPIVGVENPEGRFNYRNKAVMAVGEDSNGKPIVGFRERKTGRVIDCENCKLQAPPAMAAAKSVREYMARNGVSAYDFRTNKGLVRNIVIKTAFATGEVMAIIVIKGKRLPNEDDLVITLNDGIESLNTEESGFDYSLESVAVNINDSRTGEILGEKTTIIAGRGSIMDRLSGLDFQVSPLSFYQVNHNMAEQLYDKVMEYAGLSSAEKVPDGEAIAGKASSRRILDLYCGVGTMALIAASRGAKQTVGVEVVKGAVLDANRNAVINRIVNAVFFTGKAEDLAGKKEGVKMEDFDAVIVDPPRKGCDAELLKTIGESGIKNLVYVSCNPGTLARDIKLLKDYGYEAVEFTPFDMFPNTTEVEVAALLTR